MLDLPTDIIFEILTDDIDTIVNGYYFPLLLTCKKMYDYIYLYQKYTKIFENDKKKEITKVLLLNHCIENGIVLPNLPCLYSDYKITDKYFNYMKSSHSYSIISYLQIVKPYMRYYLELNNNDRNLIINCSYMINLILGQMTGLNDFIFTIDKEILSKCNMNFLTIHDLKIVLKFTLNLIYHINKKLKIKEPKYAIESITEGVEYIYDIYDNDIDDNNNPDNVFIIKFVTVYYPY